MTSAGFYDNETSLRYLMSKLLKGKKILRSLIMNRQIIHKFIYFAIFTGFMMSYATLSYAQSISTGISSEPETLVSMPQVSLLESKQGLQSSLVNIRSVEAPVMYAGNGRTGMASIEHDGHGIIIDSSGIIVTNTHIIANAEHIYVDLGDGNTLEVAVLYSGNTDITFIKIDAPYHLRAITWDDSSQLHIGNSIIAFANSGSDSQISLEGEVINLIKGRHSQNVNLLELKLNLNPGDSGGPILDEQGELLGLIMAESKNDHSQSYAIDTNKIQKEYLKYQGTTLVGSGAF